VTEKSKYRLLFYCLGLFRKGAEQVLPGELVPYLAFVRNAFLKMLAYRARYYVGILNYLVFISVNYFIWQAVYSGREAGALIKGFSLEEMVTYVTVAWIARTLYYSNIDYYMNDMVKTGEIVVQLLRPVNFQLMMTAQAFGESLFRLIFFTIPCGLVYLLIFPILPPASFGSLLLFLFSTAVSFVILTELHFITGLAAFYFHSINGIIRAKFFIVQLCSGLLLPIPFFPAWAQVLLNVLPFRVIAYVPLQFYLGKMPIQQMPSVFVNQIVWIGVLWILGRILSQRAFSKLTVQGG
jgi:ABC-2 type transport system permease protein